MKLLLDITELCKGTGEPVEQAHYRVWANWSHTLLCRMLTGLLSQDMDCRTSVDRQNKLLNYKMNIIALLSLTADPCVITYVDM